MFELNGGLRPTVRISMSEKVVRSAPARDVVAIAASAGGVPGIKQILKNLPADFPAAILVQMHLSRCCSSVLPNVLEYGSKLRVRWASHNEQLSAGAVRVAPPNEHLRVTPAGVTLLASSKDPAEAKPTADALFKSVAQSFGTRATGVVLTGYLDDGAGGVCTIRKHGGRVLVQDPATALAPGMPCAALATGCVDFVLPIRAMPAALVTLVAVPGAAELFAVQDSGMNQFYRDTLRARHFSDRVFA